MTIPASLIAVALILTSVTTGVMTGASVTLRRQPESSAPQIAARLDEAIRAYESGDRSQAETLLTAILGTLANATLDARDTEALTTRALYYRARLTFEAGDVAAARSDIERMFHAMPDTIVDPSLLAPTFAALVASVRAGNVTELEIAVAPPNATVTVDGRQTTAGGTVLAVRPGRHVIEAAREGHRPVRREIELPPGGRVRIELTLESAIAPGGEDLAVPSTWAAWHLHRTGYCAGRVYLSGDRIGYRAGPDGEHSWDVPLAQVREVAGNRSLGGGLEYAGAFHITLVGGENYNFTLDAPRRLGVPRKVPASQGEQLVTQLKSAVEKHRARQQE